MKKVRSADGTTIAYDHIGNGPAVILVDGALGSRADGFMAPLATLLSPHFTVITYDRRGRGESTDIQPFAIEREIEDIEALMTLMLPGSKHSETIESSWWKSLQKDGEATRWASL